MTKIQIPLPNKKYISVYLGADPHFPQINVDIQDESGEFLQDICIIRPKIKWPDEELTSDTEILIWADEYDEDYTHSFTIKPAEKGDKG